MLQSMKLELRRSEIRERLAAIAELDGEALTAEVQAEGDALGKEYTDLEPRYRAALIAEDKVEQAAAPGGDGEPAEVRALMARASVGEYLNAAATGAALNGAPAELNAALSITGGGVNLPLALLETRADAVTDTSALQGGERQMPILQRLFGRDVLMALGVRVDAVPAGRSEFPLLTGGADPGQVAEGAAKDADAASFDTQTLKPKRLTGRYVFTAEQSAQIPEIEAALRRDLSDALRAQMSMQVINGDGAGANITGLFSRLAQPAAPADIASYADYAGSAASAVDGIHADAEGAVSVLLSVGAYHHAAAVFNDGSGESATEAIKRRAMACAASSFIAPGAGARDGVEGAILHAGADVSRGDSIAAMWPAMQIIRDPYTNAGEGKTALTYVQLWDCYTALRQRAYSRLAFKTK